MGVCGVVLGEMYFGRGKEEFAWHSIRAADWFWCCARPFASRGTIVLRSAAE